MSVHVAAADRKPVNDAAKGSLAREHHRRVLVVEVISGTIAAAIAAAIGVADLPGWAIVLLVAAFTAVIALWTRAVIGPSEAKVTALWLASGVLAAAIAGILVYANESASSVNYFSTKFVALSGVAGQPPQSGPEAQGIPPGEEETAYCYVVVHGQVWLAFGSGGTSGWAPASDFRTAPTAHSALPASC